MENNLQSNAISFSSSKMLRVVVVIAVMTGLCLSPILTLRLFHPDGPFIRLTHFDVLLAVQIDQLEPLLLSFAVLWYAIVHRNVSSKLLWIFSLVLIHLIVAFSLIAIRGEGGLRWLN